MSWAMTDNCAVGQGESEVIVSKDYLVRLILPRFLTTGDTATFSAIVMNQGKQSGKAMTSIKISDDSLRLLDTRLNKKSSSERIVKNALTGRVKAIKAGKVSITVKSLFGKSSDALATAITYSSKRYHQTSCFQRLYKSSEKARR